MIKKSLNIIEKKKYKIHRIKKTNFLLKSNETKENSKDKQSSNKILVINNFSNNLNNNSCNSLSGTERELKTKEKDKKLTIKKKYEKRNNKNDNIKDDINMKEYLKTEFDDMIFEDVIKKDKRKFCNYFYDKIKSNLIIVNTFIIIDPFIPRSLKMILFILDIDLYFFVNGLFFNEEYVSEIFHSKEKENFFTFIQ